MLIVLFLTSSAPYNLPHDSLVVWILHFGKCWSRACHFGLGHVRALKWASLSMLLPNACHTRCPLDFSFPQRQGFFFLIYLYNFNIQFQSLTAWCVSPVKFVTQNQTCVFNFRKMGFKLPRNKHGQKIERYECGFFFFSQK